MADERWSMYCFRVVGANFFHHHFIESMSQSNSFKPYNCSHTICVGFPKLVFKWVSGRKSTRDRKRRITWLHLLYYIEEKGRTRKAHLKQLLAHINCSLSWLLFINCNVCYHRNKTFPLYFPAYDGWFIALNAMQTCAVEVLQSQREEFPRGAVCGHSHLKRKTPYKTNCNQCAIYITLGWTIDSIRIPKV